MNAKAKSLFDQARDRVLNSPPLYPYREFVLANWPEDEEHWEWVLSATEQDILDWCEAGEAVAT